MSIGKQSSLVTAGQEAVSHVSGQVCSLMTDATVERRRNVMLREKRMASRGRGAVLRGTGRFDGRGSDRDESDLRSDRDGRDGTRSGETRTGPPGGGACSRYLPVIPGRASLPTEWRWHRNWFCEGSDLSEPGVSLFGTAAFHHSVRRLSA